MTQACLKYRQDEINILTMKKNTAHTVVTLAGRGLTATGQILQDTNWQGAYAPTLEKERKFLCLGNKKLCLREARG
jgi:hypothetical protein